MISPLTTPCIATWLPWKLLNYFTKIMDIFKCSKACFISARRESWRYGAIKIYTRMYLSSIFWGREEKMIWSWGCSLSLIIILTSQCPVFPWRKHCWVTGRSPSVGLSEAWDKYAGNIASLSRSTWNPFKTLPWLNLYSISTFLKKIRARKRLILIQHLLSIPAKQNYQTVPTDLHPKLPKTPLNTPEIQLIILFQILKREEDQEFLATKDPKAKKYPEFPKESQ